MSTRQEKIEKFGVIYGCGPERFAQIIEMDDKETIDAHMKAFIRAKEAAAKLNLEEFMRKIL